MNEQETNQLSEREMLIAKEAAKIAVKEIQDSFYNSYLAFLPFYHHNLF